ncbi:MAG: 4Fe-4S binding protein [Planctomycetota bacterium]
MIRWFRNVFQAVSTVAQALWVGLRYIIRTYDPERRTFTEHFEYPELPVPIAPRFRGYHRFDITSCIACERCARDCPVGCIYIGKERAPGKKGFQLTTYTIDYGKCMFCSICTESCPVDCIFMGGSYDLSCYSRDGCVVDFTRLPVEIAWGRNTLDPTAVAYSKLVDRPVHGGPSA